MPNARPPVVYGVLYLDSMHRAQGWMSEKFVSTIEGIFAPLLEQKRLMTAGDLIK